MRRGGGRRRRRGSRALEAARDPPAEHLRGEQRQHRDGDGDQAEPEGARFPAGYLRERVERRGQRLGLARDVGDERDRGAELAQAAGKGEHGAGEQPRHHERQRHREEDPESIRAQRRRGVLETAVDRLDRQARGPHEQREPHHGAGQRGARPSEREDEAQALGQERPEHAPPAEEEQQGVTRHHGRKHEGQVHQALQERLAPEPPTRQDDGDDDPERQTRGHGPERDPQAQADRGVFLGAERHLTVKPCRSKSGRAAGDRRYLRYAPASGFCELASTAAGYVMGGCVSSGKKPAIFTFGSAAASVWYTIPNGASPRETRARAARTFSARATRACTDAHTPSRSRAALPYLPAGTESGSAMASRPSPSSVASGTFCPIVTSRRSPAGAMRTSRLPRRLTRVSGLISPRSAR